MDSQNSTQNQCHLCKQVFVCADQLRVHVQSAHFKPKHLCLICKKSLASAVGLTHHTLNIHYEVRNHKCAVCSRAFYSKSALNYHKKSKHSADHHFSKSQ